MMLLVLHNCLPLAAAWHFAANYAINKWLLFMIILAAGGATVYLYRAQQRIASRRVINALTTIRVLLIVLMFVMLIGLSVRWTRVGNSSGSLWLVIDTSGSMAQADAQATPLERLRWADSLGLLPADARSPKRDRSVARLQCLRDDLSYLKSRGELAVEDSEAGKRGDVQGASLRAWNDRAIQLAKELKGEPQLQPQEAPIHRSIEAATNLLKDPLAEFEKNKWPEHSATEIPWQAIAQNLDAALAELRPAADAADTAFLAQHAGDPEVQEALQQVSGKSRAQIALAELMRKPPEGQSLLDAAAKQSIKLVTFADQPQRVMAREMGGDLAKALESAPPAGHSTNISATLQFINDQTAADEHASVILIGDGRQNTGGDLIEPARVLAARNIRVFTLAAGSRDPAADAAVEAIDAPDWIYQDDTLRLTALLRLDGLVGKPLTVEFRRDGKPVNDAQGKPQTATLTPAQPAEIQRVSFQDKAPPPGSHEYEVRIAEVPGETLKDNNRQTTRVTVKKDKLNVLIVEDQPRWEYRYLVNYLARDGRVKLQTVLLQPARVEGVTRPEPVRASPQNPSSEAQLLPETEKEWSAFDMIVIGDVPRDALPAKSQEQLAKAVKDRGSTLLLIAGRMNMPAGYAGTPLADLLPVTLNNPWEPDAAQSHLEQGFQPLIAPEGSASIVSQFSIDENYNGQLWSNLPPWYWHSDQTEAKLAANVLWAIGSAVPKAGEAPSKTPELNLDIARRHALLCTLSVGQGRVMYLASDSTWRMRQVIAENLHERLWGQIIRWAVGSDLPAGGKLVRFGTNKPRYVAGDPIVVSARVLAEDLSPLKGEKVQVIARALPQTDPATGAIKSEGKLLGETTLTESPDAAGFYRGALTAPGAGGVELALRGDRIEKLMNADPSASQKTMTIDVQSQLDVERQNVNADHATLQSIAQAGAGIALDATYADLLAPHLPELDEHTQSFEQIGLFTDPKDRHTRRVHWAFLGAFVLLITTEWIIRKRGGLV